MCLILTACAAVAATLMWRMKKDSSLKLHVLALIYWGAALMWSVDGFFALSEGKPFVEISLSDTLLGILVVIGGLAAWAIYVMLRQLDKTFLRRKP
jgi:hypothetical protein